MADSSKLELVVEVDANKANASIKSINTGLSSTEQTAVQMARGASAGIDGMTASMVKGAAAGNLLADAIKKALEFAKEWTVEAATGAAHAERTATVTRALAKSHGDGAAAAQKAIEAIRAVGFAASDATTSVQKLIIADIGLDKAQSLAKIAKDAAAVSTEGVNASEAFEKIMLAVETGQARGLKSLSIFADLGKAEEVARLQAKLHGQTLDENQIREIRYKAIVEASIPIHGAAAAAAGTFDGQMAKLSRDMKDLKEDVGKAFQGELQVAVSILKSMVTFFGDHTDAITKFSAVTLAAVGIITTITAVTKGWALAQGALNLAMAANPYVLLGAGVLGAGAIIWKEGSDMHEVWERRTQQMQDDALRRDVFAGKVKVDDLKKRGMDDDKIRTLITNGRWQPGDKLDDLSKGMPRLTLAGEPDPEVLKLQIEIQKRQRENEKYLRDQALGTRPSTIMVNGKAMEVPISGFAKDAAEINKEIASRTTWVDDNGEHRVPLTKRAWDSVIEFASNKLKEFVNHAAAENRKAIADYLKDEEELAHRRQEWEAGHYQERLKHDADIAEKNLDHLRDVYAFEEQRAGFARDAKLRQLEGVDAQTIPQKIAVEQRKAEIEIEYLERVHEVKQRIYDMDTNRMLMEEEFEMRRRNYDVDVITARINELSQDRQDIRDQASEANDEAVKAARENASNRSAQIIRDHNKQIFDSLKQQAGGVFDALLSKSQSVWSAIGNSLKTALLTAIKDVVTSRVAAMLMGMFYGTRVSFAGGGGFGGSPVFGGGATGGAGLLGALGMVGAGGGGGLAQVANVAGGPGGTSGFAGPVGGGGASAPTVAAQAQGSGPGGILGMLKGNLSGLKGMFGFGNVSRDSQGGLWSTVGNQSINIDSLGGKLTALGKSNAALMGGSMLAMDGLLGSRRGTLAGIAESTAGGAMIGFKFGGPLGALIGGSAGLLAGIGERLAGVEAPEAEAKRLVKQLYQVNIDTAMAKQIVDLAKQKYSGHVSIAVRDPDIRKVIELYAAGTGQHMPMSTTTPHGASLMEQGGHLYQAPTYMFGNPNIMPSSLPTAGGPAGPYQSGPTYLALHIDGNSAADFMTQKYVTPELVQSQWSSAAASSNGRVQNAAWMSQPNLTTG